MSDLEAAIAAVETAPSALSWLGLGNAMFKHKKLEGAELAYRQSLEKEPLAPGTWANLGATLRGMGRYDEALATLRYAVKLQPCSEAHSNLGNLLAYLGYFNEALAEHRAALALTPKNAGCWGNLGNALKSLGQVSKALEAYDRGLALDPDSSGLRWNRGQALMLGGDLKQGFAQYDWRLKAGGREPPGWRAWQGEPCEELYLHAEQGFGDAIQYVRFAKLLPKLGIRAVLACHPRLARILGSVEGISRVVPKGELGPKNVHLMSLPGILGVGQDLPSDPYIRAEPELLKKWRWLGGSGLKVGICWQGNPNYEADNLRSPPLSALEPLAQVAELFSLQKNEGSDQLAGIGFEVRDLAAELDTGPDAFVDTAAAISHLDLVVTSDTATAHLAGALGCKTWTALPFAPDARWHLHQSECPWYPSMTLYRQAQPHCWGELFERMARDLSDSQEKV